MEYGTAMALAHIFLLAEPYSYCVQVRLVKVLLEYSYSTKELGVGPAIGLHDHEKETVFVSRKEVPDGK